MGYISYFQISLNFQDSTQAPKLFIQQAERLTSAMLWCACWPGYYSSVKKKELFHDHTLVISF